MPISAALQGKLKILPVQNAPKAVSYYLWVKTQTFSIIMLQRVLKIKVGPRLMHQ
jgi:hypothetical protein